MTPLSSDQCLHQTDTLRTAMHRLNQAGGKLCLIMSPTGVLQRTLSDGDLRRALLQGADLDDPLGVLPEKSPITRPVAATSQALLDCMDEHGIHTVVLIDTTGAPVGLADRLSLQKGILLSPPHVGTTETTYVQRAFDDNWIAPAGPNLEAFEDRLATVSGCQHAIALSSGTAGLHLALRALDLPRHATIYVSDLTFVGTVQPVFYEGMSPVLIDSEPETWNMSPQALARRLAADAAAGTLPGAIIVVHLYGQSADIEDIINVADQYDVPVIEDAAESLGASYQNQPSGAHGLISVFSFNGNKIITTSGGGALTTNDAKIAARVRYLATQGRDPTEHYQHSQIAYNYRMSNILAGVGLGQLDVLAERVAARQAIFQRYVTALADVPGVSFQQDAPQSQGNRWLTAIELDPNHIRIHPYQVMRALRGEGIETRPGWKPLHMQPLCQKYSFVPHSDTDVISAAHFQKALCLPTGSALSKSEQDRIIRALRAQLLTGES